MWSVLASLFAGISVVALSYKYNERFLEWLRFQSIGTRDYIIDKLNLMHIEVDPGKLLIGQFLLSFGGGFIAFLLLLPHFVPGFLFGLSMIVILWKVPKPAIDYWYQRRVDLFVMQMIDALALMSNGLKSGLSVAQSIGLVVQEMPNPIREDFEMVLNQNKLGVSLEECFVALSKRVISDDVEMFVTSVNILKETGGNLAETFDTIVTTIRERVKVENKIKALTSQGKVQGIFVLSVPPLLTLTISQSDPDLMEPLFTTPIGWVVLFVVFILEIVGFFVIMKITKIDV